ncbi:hypothetical protein W02_16070 [Nitrospira sp. KM1]|uniref:CgeB family protein n=1 Tax=Nitrospira sp. KM1 TaxID=1936990 RepID=UPI0013A789B4|nr:glycosyltransferase [Nitrospira sp. KM1]BCA54467.1 hypothetical protein W02_16070 [Nitrospira sp. KM1]
MKILIVNTDYPDFLDWLYQEHAGLDERSYEEQIRVRAGSLYGVADFYSSNLRVLGHEAHDIYANNETLQLAWAFRHGSAMNEHGRLKRTAESFMRIAKSMTVGSPVRYLRQYVGSGSTKIGRSWNVQYELLMAQVKHYKPDVLLNQAVDSISGRFMKEAKPYVRLIVGQHAAIPLPTEEDLGAYDLMVSSFPATVEDFQRRGLCAHLWRLAFEPRVLSALSLREKKWDISFIGSLFAVHNSRVNLLRLLCGHFPQLRIWSPTVGGLPKVSPIRAHYMGQAWGRQMYDILSSSKLTINHHGDVAPYANNMRLYEATGVGTCLLTDWKPNLCDMFAPGREVLAYRRDEECVELVRRYLGQDGERETVARAGQDRTLREHTYYHRMQEFVGIVEKYL